MLHHLVLAFKQWLAVDLACSSHPVRRTQKLMHFYCLLQELSIQDSSSGAPQGSGQGVATTEAAAAAFRTQEDGAERS